jgi:shikimate kinase
LSASASVIEARTRAQGPSRPLLADPDPRARIEELLERRRPAYAQADLQIDTSDRELDELVEDIAAFLETNQ